MSGTTSHFGLSKLSAGDSLSEDSYKYVNADRETIDSILYLGAVGHHHSGADATDNSPDTALTLELDETQGVIPAGTRVYYKYTLVDVYGNETGPSPEAYVDTDNPISVPNSATLSSSSSGGTLVFGQYFYVLSAYETTSTQETKALNIAYITILSGTTNEITITLPSLPSGADGFNIYRKSPGGQQYFFLDSVDMTGATPPTTYVDSGAEEDCNRTLPLVNTTNASNAVLVTFPGATPVVPEGYTWKIYRTYTNGVWTNSFLHHVVEETTEGSGIITTEYEDLGLGTSTGQPPSSTVTIGNPEKIDLADMAEVQNTLPPGGVSKFPAQVTLWIDDFYVVGTRQVIWICEYPAVEIVGVRASHAIAGASTQTIIDVNSGLSPATASTIFTTQGNRPRINAGSYVGTVAVPDSGFEVLAQGDVITIDVDQDGGGATPTHKDLCITIHMWVTMTSLLSDDPVWE